MTHCSSSRILRESTLKFKWLLGKAADSTPQPIWSRLPINYARRGFFGLYVAIWLWRKFSLYMTEYPLVKMGILLHIPSNLSTHQTLGNIAAIKKVSIVHWAMSTSLSKLLPWPKLTFALFDPSSNAIAIHLRISISSSLRTFSPH